MNGNALEMGKAEEEPSLNGLLRNIYQHLLSTFQTFSLVTVCFKFALPKIELPLTQVFLVIVTRCQMYNNNNNNT